MQTQTITNARPQTETSLHQLTSNMVREFLPAAIERKSFFLNNVPRNMLLNTDKAVFSHLLSSLLSIVSRHTHDSCINLNIKEYHDIVLFQINDKSILNNTIIADNLNKLQPIAEKLGGSITINSIPSKMATITLSFFNPSKTSGRFS